MEKIEEYVDHRRRREEEVLRALLGSPRTPQDLVQEIYAGYAKELYPAASRSLLAHLLKLEREGRVVRSGHGDRFALSEPWGNTT